MPRTLVLQVIASIGALVGVALLYVGLKQESDVLSAIAFVLFTVCLLVTPALRILPSRSPSEE